MAGGEVGEVAAGMAAADGTAAMAWTEAGMGDWGTRGGAGRGGVNMEQAGS